jgi:hypothetical protein
MKNNTPHKKYETLDDYLCGNQNLQPYLVNIIQARDEFCDGDTRTLVKALVNACGTVPPQSRTYHAISRDSQTAELLLLYETEAKKPQRAILIRDGNTLEVIAQDITRATTKQDNHD